jgi:lipid-A-disaccharide synthase-like uncharacterized protein
MPQFDLYSFSSQVFWTLLGFSFFYFFTLKFYLVQLAEVLKMRQKLLTAYSKKKKGSTEPLDILSHFLGPLFKK